MADNNPRYPVSGAGLGLRRGFIDQIMADPPRSVDFMEVAPENWIRVGGKPGRKFRWLAERYPFLIHGLSLSIGGPAPLDESLLRDIKAFMRTHGIRYYSEHLSYCGDDGQLYDLMPIPFTEDAVSYVAERIRRAQDILEQRMAVENVSYYAPADTAMSEIDFMRAVLEEADCDLLLDINNIVVNSINHRYDPRDFMLAMPADRVKYFHVAGHYVEAEDLRVDTHGDAVGDPVWDLLAQAYAHFGPVPTLLERDFNFPPLAELLDEVDRIRALQQAATESRRAGAAGG
ncbi:MAG: HvfB family MNIO-type RiPP peptide maturase [Woeseiaceae bacterium]